MVFGLYHFFLFCLLFSPFSLCYLSFVFDSSSFLHFYCSVSFSYGSLVSFLILMLYRHFSFVASVLSSVFISSLLVFFFLVLFLFLYILLWHFLVWLQSFFPSFYFFLSLFLPSFFFLTSLFISSVFYTISFSLFFLFTLSSRNCIVPFFIPFFYFSLSLFPTVSFLLSSCWRP